ncbi:DNA methyltransferase [Shewanella putrefaciens]|nr:DNA methyltransferase [Shewanella putrefaciens]QGS48040.1 DNA modification methylase [Shewanella putrefaciens]
MAKLCYLKENALNAICPYFTMFPLEFPMRHLAKFKKEDPVIIDPFCGRGTSMFAARKLGLKAWGIDSSPVATAIARAKLASCSKEDILDLARDLLQNAATDMPESEFFSKLYTSQTLKDVCALREGLLSLAHETDASVMLRALVLGALHGPLNKSLDTAIYFSNQMPRTFASKPDYSVRYWDQRSLVPPAISVLDVLKRKLDRIPTLDEQFTGSFHQIIEGDSQLEITRAKVADDFSIVITSPPYYGMKTYVQDQWIRNWFLGGASTVDYTSGPQLEHGGVTTFAESLGKVWRNMADTRADSLRMFIRFGIIPSAKIDAKKIMQMSLEASGKEWKIISIRSAETAAEGKRQATQMKSKSSAAIEYDFHVVRR